MMMIHYNFTCKYVLFNFQNWILVTDFVDPLLLEYINLVLKMTLMTL
jgi:hypothetical protein